MADATKQFIIVAVILSGFIILAVMNETKTEIIQNSKKLIIGNAKIGGTGFTRYKGLHCSYTFTVNGKEYTESENYQDFSEKDFLYITGKSFPVIYAEENPEGCHLLLSTQDFKEFNLPYPDSLKWLYSFIK